MTQSLSLPKKEKNGPQSTSPSSDIKAAEVQRIVNIISKMAQQRGGRLATSLNRLTSFPCSSATTQQILGPSPAINSPTLLPKRKRDTDNYCSPIKRFRNEKCVIHDLKQQPQKKTPFILPENFIRIVK
jgi:hypothetical protein